MPTRLCIHPRCPNPATYRGRCTNHAPAHEQATHRNRHIYNSRRWQLLRRRVLFNQPLCAIEGCDEISTDADHILPIEAGGNPWAMANLQGLCHSHHSEKTRREQQVGFR